MESRRTASFDHRDGFDTRVVVFSPKSFMSDVLPTTVIVAQKQRNRPHGQLVRVRLRSEFESLGFAINVLN